MNLKQLLFSPGAASLYGGAGTAFGMDWLQHPDVKVPVVDTIRDIADGKADKFRIGNLGLNAALGGVGGSLVRRGIASPSNVGSIPAGLSTMVMAPAKDLLLNVQSTPAKLNDALDATAGISKALDKNTTATASNSRNLNILLGLLGAGALATGAIATGKYLTRKDPKSEMGKLKLKLPGSKKDPNTTAEVELPIDMPGMSPNLIEGLNRGVRLQARKNVRANSFKRDPWTGKLIPYEEWKARQQAQQIAKTASVSAGLEASPGLANLLAKSLGAGVGGTIGALGGGVGVSHLAKSLGAGDKSLALLSLLGAGAGGLGGVLLGASTANTIVPPIKEVKPEADAYASFANTGAAPAGYAVAPDADDFNDEDLDKYASAPPTSRPIRSSNGLLWGNGASMNQPQQPAVQAPTVSTATEWRPQASTTHQPAVQQPTTHQPAAQQPTTQQPAVQAPTVSTAQAQAGVNSARNPQQVAKKQSQGFWSNLKNGIRITANEVGDKVRNTAVGRAAGHALGGIQSGYTAAADGIAHTGGKIVDTIGDSVKETGAMINRKVDQAGNSIAEVGQAVGKRVGDTVNSVGDTVNAAGQYAYRTLDQAGNAIGQTARNVANSTPVRAVRDTVTATGELAGDAIRAHQQRAKAILDGASQTAGQVSDWTGRKVRQGVNSVGQYIDNAGQAIEAAGMRVGDAARNAGQDIGDAARAAGESDTAKTIERKAKDYQQFMKDASKQGSPPPLPSNRLARRPVTNTLPPSPGLAPAAAKAGSPPTGNLGDLSIKLQGTANDALDMQTKQAYTIDYISFPVDGVKSAYDLTGRMEAQTIMARIYNEDPSYWPYGLGIPGHDGVYLVRDKMTKQAAGFVGWQQKMEGGRLIGSYSIGILPEYRGHGFAKEAVAKILREKADGVDEVRSYVMPHNQKSKALASSLGVTIHEEF